MDYFVGLNRVYRVMREQGLTCKKRVYLRAKRRSYPSKPRAKKVNEIWGIDMTKVKIGSGWVYIHIVLDWWTKKIVGFHLSSYSKTEDWLKALYLGISEQFPEGFWNRKEDLYLVSDNGCQPLSAGFKTACKKLGIQQIFTSFNNPKGNADTERVIRTLKEDFWLREWDFFDEAKKDIEKIICKYNTNYPHSAIGYQTPYDFDLMSKKRDFPQKIKQKKKKKLA